jgi:hypothetical protein
MELMTKADKLRKLFPDFVGSPDIEIYKDDESLKVVTYLDVPENHIEIMCTNFDEGAGVWYNGDTKRATLDDASNGVNEFDYNEFKLIIQGLCSWNDFKINII